MKLEFTKEEHRSFIKNHFQVITAYVLDENNEMYYILPIKENYHKHDQIIAKIQAEKFGFKVNSSYLIEDYKPENKTFCANYERDNTPVIEYFYVEKPNNPVDFKKEIDNVSKYYIGIDFFTEKLVEKCDDPVVEKVREKLLSRSKIGYNKYKTTLKNNTKDNYLAHAQMEAMDLANYLECLLQQKKDITQLVKDTPNYYELGEKIAKIYGN
jgi:hypothetical protein